MNPNADINRGPGLPFGPSDRAFLDYLIAKAIESCVQHTREERATNKTVDGQVEMAY